MSGQPKSVKWLKDGRPLQESAHMEMQQLPDRVVLVIHDVSFGDAGDYRCEVETDKGRVVSECSLIVEGDVPSW